ncbi:VOC family protein [Streptomyces sp. BBFR51]|uniref:VOC family protein n=1 Tax=Streptomyces sp. BBFR51 TaxID=3372856 RepID=UPI0037DCCA04
MSSALTEPGTVTETRSGVRRPPARLHHNNFYTGDLEATRHFYEDIAGLPLKVFWIEPVPEGQGTEQIGHAFFGLADGGFMAFMQYTESAVQATMVSGEQPTSVHIALKVDDEQQRDIRKQVEAEGYEHFFIDHGILRSLYVFDPNRLLVEFAVDPDGHKEMYQMEAERAHEMMRRFLAGDRTPTLPEKL